jgi:hypothetical protein
MRIVLLVIFIGLVIFGPQLWTRRVFAQNSTPRPDYPGTGGELARHLLDRFDMKHVEVETTELGDPYDPETKTLRLTPDKYSGKSLTALTVAAHEVGLPAARTAHTARASRPWGGKAWWGGDDGHPNRSGGSADPCGRCVRPDRRNGDNGNFHTCAPHHTPG